jgi:hypothetical protein
VASSDELFWQEWEKEHDFSKNINITSAKGTRKKKQCIHILLTQNIYFTPSKL